MQTLHILHYAALLNHWFWLNTKLFIALLGKFFQLGDAMQFQNADICRVSLFLFLKKYSKVYLLLGIKSLPSTYLPIIFQSESNFKSADCVCIPSFYMKTTLFYRKTRALARLSAWHQIQEWPDRDLYITQKANIVSDLRRVIAYSHGVSFSNKPSHVANNRHFVLQRTEIWSLFWLF